MLQRLYATSSILNFRPTNFLTYRNIRPTTARSVAHFNFLIRPTFMVEYYSHVHSQLARLDVHFL